MASNRADNPQAPGAPDGTASDIGAPGYDQTVQSGWTDLGQTLVGTRGAPALAHTGVVHTVLAQSERTLTGALSFNLASLALGLASTDTPFRGAFFVPFPDDLRPDTTDAPGERVLLIPWPANNTTAGLHIRCQRRRPDLGRRLGSTAGKALADVTQ